MKKNLIAVTFLGLVAIFVAGCSTTTETTSTTSTTESRTQGVQYAR